MNTNTQITPSDLSEKYHTPSWEISLLIEVKERLEKGEKLDHSTQRKLLEIAARKWCEVERDQVHLGTWKRCGSAHCLGGWMGTWEEFQFLGIFPDEFEGGAPALLIGEKKLTAYQVADLLFGDEELFFPIKNLEEIYQDEWSVVAVRIQNQISILLQKYNHECSEFFFEKLQKK